MFQQVIDTEHEDAGSNQSFDLTQQVGYTVIVSREYFGHMTISSRTLILFDSVADAESYIYGHCNEAETATIIPLIPLPF